MKLKLEKNKSNQYLIIDSAREEKVYFSSKINPEKEAERNIQKNNDDIDAIFIFGGGNVYMVQKACCLFSNKIIVIIDNNKNIEKIYQKLPRDFFIDKMPEIVTTNEIKNYFKKHLEEKRIKNYKIYRNRQQYQKDIKVYKTAEKELEELIRDKNIYRATINRFEKIWLKNIIRNYRHIAYSVGVDQLTKIDKLKQLSAIIVAAGPSLKYQIDLLKNIYSQHFIIAVDTVYKTLLHHNIIPDLVVIVDPQKVNSRYLENISEALFKKTLFLFEPSTYPRALSNINNNFISFDTIFPFYHLLSGFFAKKGKLEMGGSVATTAMAFAMKIQFQSTALIGLDLSFSDDSYHVPGTMYEEHWFSRINRINSFDTMTYQLLDTQGHIAIKNNLGQTSYIDSKFALFINWFERQDHGENIYNATYMGAILKGYPTIALEEYHQKYSCEVNEKEEVIQMIQKIYQSNSSIDKSIWEEFNTEVKGLLNSFQMVSKLIRPIVEKLHFVLEASNIKMALAKHPKLFDELDQVDQFISSNFPGKNYLNIVLQRAIDEVAETSKEISTVLKNSYKLYKSILEGAELNKDCFRELENQIKKKELE